MRIADIRDGMRRVDVEGKILDVETPREVSLKTGGTSRVATAQLQDRSGVSIGLVLWDENIGKVSKGDSVSVKNGYTNTFKGMLRLNVGRFGTVTKLEAPL